MSSIQDLIIDKVLPTALAGASGVIAAVWKFTQGIVKRIEALEVKFNTLEAKLAAADAQLKVVASKHDLDELKEAIKRVRVINTSKFVVFETKIESMEQAVQNWQDMFQNLNKEQQDQWQEIKKSMGELQGYLKGMQHQFNKVSGEYHGLTKK